MSYISYEELISLFIKLYSLPSLSEQIKDLHEDSHASRLLETQDILRSILQILDPSSSSSLPSSFLSDHFSPSFLPSSSTTTSLPSSSSSSFSSLLPSPSTPYILPLPPASPFTMIQLWETAKGKGGEGGGEGGGEDEEGGRKEDEEEATFMENEGSPIMWEVIPVNYNEMIVGLKNLLWERIFTVNEGMPVFLIINEINKKLDGKYTDLCEQLMMDLVNKKKEDRIKEEVKNYLTRKFQKYDFDKNGNITIFELEKFVGTLGLPLSVAQDIMDNVDITNDGLITLAEFEKFFEDKIIKNYKIFFNLDSDNDKRLNISQVRQTIHEIYPHLFISSQIYEHLFERIDQDKTGLINFDEWCDLLFLLSQKTSDILNENLKLMSLTVVDSQEIPNHLLEEDILEAIEGKYSLFDIGKTLFCGGVAGAVSRTVTAPLERLKIFYQTMYPDSTPPTLLRGLVDVYREKGVKALFRGNSLSVSMNVVEQALRFAIIEYSKLHFGGDNGIVDPHKYILIGFITTISSTMVIFPMEVVRVRAMLSDENTKIFRKKFHKIWVNNGFQGFYSGIVPHLMSVLPAGTMNVFFYNNIKKFMVDDGELSHHTVKTYMFVGGLAAAFTGTFTYPFNLITSRFIMANRKEKAGLFGLIKNIWNHEGIEGFYKGYKASILRIIMGQSCNFGTYEGLKSYMRIHKEY